MTKEGQDRSSVSHAEEYEIWGLLSQVSDAMLKARGSELSPFGLTSVQAGVMYVVKVLQSKGIPATPSEISRWVVREPHTISTLLVRMQKHGLVTLARSSQGRPQVLVSLTEKGEDLYRGQTESRRVIPEILETLSPEERRQFRSFLERLRQRALEKLVVQPPFP